MTTSLLHNHYFFLKSNHCFETQKSPLPCSRGNFGTQPCSCKKNICRGLHKATYKEPKNKKKTQLLLGFMLRLKKCKIKMEAKI